MNPTMPASLSLATEMSSWLKIPVHMPGALPGPLAGAYICSAHIKCKNGVKPSCRWVLLIWTNTDYQMASHTWNVIFLRDSVADLPPPRISSARGSSRALSCSRKEAFPKDDMQVTMTKRMGSDSPDPSPVSSAERKTRRVNPQTLAAFLSCNLPQRWGCW